MSEPKPVLKSGDALDFTIGDKTLTIEPVPYGNIKKILRIAFAASKEIAAGQLSGVPELIDKNLYATFPLLFAKGKYNFITPEWMEETMTVPTLRKMMEAAIVVNGLQDFFDKGVTKKPVAVPPEPLTPSTPSEKDGSTTSADLAMAGGPKT